MNKETIKEAILEALGESSALFMSQDIKGTEIVMPDQELIRIANEAANKLIDLVA